MAAAALGSELAAVRIVSPVTSNAGIRLMDAITHALRMTRFTLQACVRTGQRKMRLVIMVKRPTGPRDGVMARAAVHSEPSFVAIVIAVARYTLLRSIFEATCLMTRRTCGAGVFANEGKPRQSMVKTHRGRPAGVAMTLLTLRALLTGVRIIGAMARYAGHREAHLPSRLNVTLLTGQAGMPPAEWKLRLPRVIEVGAPPVCL
ncbi:MAG: hypothetical protein HY054_04530 [Proteobacteria bacterium]|nr:hypothetical protein [Pseudomonadota bacterium]